MHGRVKQYNLALPQQCYRLALCYVFPNNGLARQRRHFRTSAFLLSSSWRIARPSQIGAFSVFSLNSQVVGYKHDMLTKRPVVLSNDLDSLRQYEHNFWLYHQLQGWKNLISAPFMTSKPSRFHIKLPKS